MKNEFSSASVIHPAIKYLVAVILMAVLGYLTVSKGYITLAAAMVFPISISLFIILFKWPKLGLYASILLSFLIPPLNRFVYNIPYGFVVEIILVLVYIILFFKHFKKLDFSPASNDIVAAISIWMLYILLQIGNPWAQSIEAWAYAMRGVALIQFLIIPLVFVLFREKKDLYQFMIFYFILSGFGIFWAAKQQLFGLTTAENAYLYNSGAHVTHMLFGKLRVFSYYFDAGTFGAAMGQLCIITALLYLGPFKKKLKYTFLALSLGAFYALMISGTRGAIAIPATGAVVFVILIKKFKYIVITASILMIGFLFLKYTSVGNSNYNVNRLRTALDPNDPSLNVRIRNREKLTAYLSDKPFGGGVGSAGTWGQRFTPNTWLANFPPDGLYTRIRAETGIVGYLIYLFVWLYILYRGFRVCWNLRDPKFKSIATAFLAGYAGILVANYGNEVMTQYPNNFITFISLTFIFIIDRWDKEESQSKLENKDPE
ncbi:O-antigen ligase family protein [Owenweeksia hongkongensis]|uniref:O-antigen ligase family protein n=1 Tax=Owenweeksia hongkongensis TaxID=253245 RepID=UPI003A91C28C